MNLFLKAALGIAFVLFVLAAITAGFALFFNWVWNAVIPSVFNGPSINLTQSFFIVLLLSAIGGFFKSRSK